MDLKDAFRIITDKLILQMIQDQYTPPFFFNVLLQYLGKMSESVL